MKKVEARKLKIGDFVVMDDRSRHRGLVMVVETKPIDRGCCCFVNLRQPKVNEFGGCFRMIAVDTRHLKRYES